MAPPHSALAPPLKIIPPAARHLIVEYLGFRNVGDRREYLLCARSGTESREYTLWIAHAAFAAGRALLQDGPDICYQKLRRALVDAELTGGAHCVEVTESELLEYRTAHTPTTRRSFTPKPNPPAPSASSSPWPTLPPKRG